MRVDAGVGADVDARDRGARAAQERLGQLALASGEREHRAVVVGVGVEVEEARRRERRPIASSVARSRPSLTLGTVMRSGGASTNPKAKLAAAAP